MVFSPVFTNVPPIPEGSAYEKERLDRYNLRQMLYGDGHYGHGTTDRDFGLKALVDDKTLEDIQKLAMEDEPAPSV